MSSNFLARSRKWVGASALAILVGLGGGTAFLVASTPMVAAQVQPAAQVTVPEANPALGFADLVDAVKPAVVSIIVQGRDAPAQNYGDEFNQGIPDLPEDNPLRKFFEQFGGPPSNGDRSDRGGPAPQGR
jgi:serine protease Do